MKKIVVTDRYLLKEGLLRDVTLFSGFVFVKLPKGDEPIWENAKLVPAGYVYIDKIPASFNSYGTTYVQAIAERMDNDTTVIVAFSPNRYGELCASIVQKQLLSLLPNGNVVRAYAVNATEVVFGSFLDAEETDGELRRIWYDSAFMFNVLDSRAVKIPLRKARLIRKLSRLERAPVPNANPEGVSLATALFKSRKGE